MGQHISIDTILDKYDYQSVKSTDARGWTILHHAAVKGDRISIIKCIISMGANINAQTNDSRNNGKMTPLMLAVKYKHEAIVRCLMKYTNINVCLQNSQGFDVCAMRNFYNMELRCQDFILKKRKCPKLKL